MWKTRTLYLLSIPKNYYELGLALAALVVRALVALLVLLVLLVLGVLTTVHESYSNCLSPINSGKPNSLRGALTKPSMNHAKDPNNRLLRLTNRPPTRFYPTLIATFAVFTAV